MGLPREDIYSQLCLEVERVGNPCSLSSAECLGECCDRNLK
jgi:hypothetical protein